MKLELPDQQQTSTQLALARSAAGDRRRHGGLAAGGAEGRPPGEQHAGRAFAARSVGRSGAARTASGRDAARALDLQFRRAQQGIQVEYWVGNQSAGVRTTQNGFVATLTNLHKGTTMPAPWILLIDTLAGAMIFLSISGAILWWETHRRRRLGIAIFGVSVAVTVALAMSPLQW